MTEDLEHLPGIRNGDLLRAVVSTADDAIYAKTLEGTIVSWNPAAARIYGYSEQEALGMNVSALEPHDRHGETGDINVRVARGERISRFPTERQTKDGRIIQMSISVSPVRNAAGQIVGASVIAHELTDDEQRMQELRSIALASAARASRIDGIARMVRELNGALESVRDGLEGFASADELEDRLTTLEAKVKKDIEKRLKAQEEKTRSFTVRALATVAAVVLVFAAAFAWLGHHTSNDTAHRLYVAQVRQQRSIAIDGCNRRNEVNKGLTDLINTSVNQGFSGIDVSKLSPDTLKILREVAAASSPPSQSPLVQFAKDHYSPIDCTKLPKPTDPVR